MIEFVLVAPMLFALAFGIFDFGRGMSANVTVTNSAREGARYLATHATSWQSPGRTGVSAPGEGRFNDSCYGSGATPTAPNADSPQGKAWEQLQNAGLDLSSVTMIVRFYKQGNDPALGGIANDTFTCSGGTITESNGGYSPATGEWVQFEVKYTYTPVTPIINSLVHSISMDQTTTMVLE